jgi:hypothetical protein
MTPNDQKKMRGILDAIRFDGKSTDHAHAQLVAMFDHEELEMKNRREETRLFYVTFALCLIAICFVVGSCYQHVPCI